MSVETAAELIERLTREGLESLRDDVARGRRETGLKSLDERGAMSEIVRDQYTGRYPLELIQNANDAESSEGLTAGQVKFVLTDTALLVADQGAGFGVDQVNAICGLARSSKDPRKNVGYKGLGFKAVREITDRPQIISIDVRFGFDAERLRREVEAVAGELPEGQRLPDYAFPFTLTDEDFGEDLGTVESLISAGFRTVIRLPFREAALRDRVAQHISNVVTSRMLLFLDATGSLEIVGTSNDSSAQADREHKEDHEFLVLEEAGTTKAYLIFRRKFEITDRHLVEGLGRAWQDVESVRAIAAVPLGPDDKPRGGSSEPIYVYFPTEEETGFSIALHADFQMDLDRRRISTSMQAAEYNEWLRSELVGFVSGEVVPWLVEHYPGVSVLEAIASRKPATGHGLLLRREVFEGLRDADMVPCRDGLHPPTEAKLLPSSVPDLSVLHSWLPDERPYVLPDAQEIPEIRSMLANELSVSEVSSGTLLAELDPPTEEMEVEQFYSFLLAWSRRDARFIDNLRWARCVRLRGGRWATPSEPAFLPRQRNEADFPVELNIPIVDVPDVKGIDDLLERAGVKQLDWRIVVTDFLKPLLTDVHQVPPATRESALAALRTYYDTRRGESGDVSIREAVQSVLLPASCLAIGGDFPPLVQANELYFGTKWLPDSRLEAIYGPFRRSGFLDVPPPINPDDAQASRGFFTWLGVADRPRVRESRDPLSAPAEWRASKEYTSAARDPEKHSESQMLIDPQLDRIHDLVRISDRRRLVALWYELTINWPRYAGEIRHATWRCRAGAHRGDRNRTLTSSTAFTLQEARCFPVLRDGQADVARARDVWRPLNNTPAKVRALMPIPDPAIGHISPALGDWLGFVDGARASSESLVGLLVEFAQRIDVKDDLDDADVEAALWLLRQLNRTWTSDDNDRDSGSVPLLARQAGVRRLVRRPYLVNDPLLAEAWSDVVPIFDGGRDLDAVTSGLQLGLIDDEIDVAPVVGDSDDAASERVLARLADTFPAVLALVAERFPSRVGEVAGRLNALNVFCSAELSLESRFRDFAPRLLPDAQVYFSRDATVYLRIENSEPDWATLGLRLADYLGVDLGDAAATLLITSDPAIDPAITRRYLRAHRIGEADLRRAERSLLSAVPPEPEPGDQAAAGEVREEQAASDGEPDTQGVEQPETGIDTRLEPPVAQRDSVSSPGPSLAGRVDSAEELTGPGAQTTARQIATQDTRHYVAAERARPSGNPPPAMGVNAASRSGEERLSNPPHDDSRFYSYLVAEGSREARMAARAESEAMRIGLEGVNRVIEFEAAAGRVAIPQQHNNKGFDIVSESPDGRERRVIEVKATADAWPLRGIPVSSSQMEKNREIGQEFWLYVVEYAASPEERTRVIPIRDPGSAVDYFVFDPGWRNLASGDQT